MISTNFIPQSMRFDWDSKKTDPMQIVITINHS